MMMNNNSDNNNNNNQMPKNPNHKKVTLFPTPTGHHHQKKDAAALAANTTRGTTGCHTDLHTQIEAYSASGDTLYTIPIADVHYMPMAQAAAEASLPASKKLLHLCPYYNAKEGPASCPLTSESHECDHIHASLDNAKVHDIHVNYLWRNPSNVKYDRFPEGKMFRVAPPNEVVLLDVIPSHLVLKTKAFDGHNNNDNGKCVISHCAHYYYNRVCNRGSRCCFVHAVSFTSSANPQSTIKQTTSGGPGNLRNNNKLIKDELSPEDRKSFGRTQHLREFASAASIVAKKQQEQQQKQIGSSGIVVPHMASNTTVAPPSQKQVVSPPAPAWNKSKLAQAFDSSSSTSAGSPSSSSFSPAVSAMRKQQQQQQQQRQPQPFTPIFVAPSLKMPLPSSTYSSLPMTPVTLNVQKSNDCDASSCSSASAEEINAMNEVLFVAQQQHQQQQPQDRQFSPASSFAPVDKKKSLRKIHNPYSWTRTTMNIA